MTHLRIRTPEGVEFSLPLAGPVSRALALLLDSALVWCGMSMLGGIARSIRWLAPDIAGSAMFVGMLVLPFAYGMAMEWLNHGQTLGKRAFGLRVVDSQGLKLRPSQVVLRNLLRAVDFLPFFYVVGGLASLLTRRAQRLGDIAAGTVVIRIPNPTRPDLEPLAGTRFNSLRAHPHLAARLRQRVHPAEAALALQAVSRRGEIEAGPRIELFRELAGHFRELVEFPAETTDGLTDEQYVRAVVDLLHRPHLSGTDPVARVGIAGSPAATD
jgi:uncharacterized RDD family membrane protein YckC